MKNLLLSLFVFCIYLNTSAQEYTLQTPIKHNSKLNDVHFPSDLVGYITEANGGKIYKTIDGGESWKELHRTVGWSINQNIYGVWFTSVDTGYVTCGNGSVYRTYDGGETWTNFPTAVSNGLNDIYFINDSVGFIAGFSGLILKTVNRGANWTQITSNTTSKLNSIYFTSSSTGYIAGFAGTILKTTDSGNTWSKLITNVTIDFISIHFPTASTGYAAGFSGNVLKTDNAGSTWTTKATGMSSMVSGFRSVYFTSATTGVIAGDNGLLYKTTNGGSSFTNLNPWYRNYSAFAFTSTRSLLVGEGIILESINNWSSFSVNEWGVEHSAFNNIDFFNEQIGVCGGSNYPGASVSSIVRTFNKGKIWTKEFSSSGSGVGVYDVGFADYKTLYAVAGDRVGKSIDTGNTWTWSNAFAGYLESVYFLNKDTGFVGGNGFVTGIYSTKNGGQTWTTTSIPVTVYEFQFLNKDLGYFAGEGGTIGKTIDGGLTWSTVNVGNLWALYRLDFVNDSVGYAGGDNGVVRKTTDGGQTWTPLYPTSDDIRKIHFITADSGYVGTYNGNVFKTVDGGATWTVDLNEFFNMSIMDYEFIGNTVYAAGANGEIFYGKLGCNGVAGLTALTGDTMVCQGDYVQYKAEGNYYNTYLWTVNGSVQSSTDSTMTRQWVNPGTFTLKATAKNLCGVSGGSKELVIQVNSKPAVSLSAIDPHCENDSAYTLTQGLPSGGMYAGQGVAGNLFDPSITGAGNFMLSYSYTDSSTGCTATAQKNVVIRPKPNLSFTSEDSICSGTGNYLLSAVPSGGIFSGDELVGSMLNTDSLTPGGYEAAYSYTNQYGCSDTISMVVEILDAPSVTFNLGIDTVHSDDPLVLIGGDPAGGIYSGTAVTPGYFEPVQAGPGMHVLNYSYTDQNGCTGLAMDTVYVSITVGNADIYAQDLRIYPNPAEDNLYLNFMQGSIHSIHVRDLSGRIVKVIPVASELDISDLSPGLYNLVLDGSEGVLMKRFVKATR